MYGCERDVARPDFLVAGQPEQQLFAFIQWFLQRGLKIGKDSLLDQIHMQELANPSPVLDKVVEKLIRPVHVQLREIVGALLPENINEETLRFHCFSVIGQCNLYKIGKPIMMRLYPDIELEEQAIDRLVQHIYAVSLAGIKAEHLS